MYCCMDMETEGEVPRMLKSIKSSYNGKLAVPLEDNLFVYACPLFVYVCPLFVYVCPLFVHICFSLSMIVSLCFYLLQRGYA